MKKTLAILALAAMTASAQEKDTDVAVKVQAEEMRKCQEEGGCVLVTKKLLLKLIEMAEATEKTCRNTI